jgi:hypothetical protein
LTVEPFRAIRLTVTLKCLKVALLPEVLGVGLGFVADPALDLVPGAGAEPVAVCDGVGSGATVEGRSLLHDTTSPLIARSPMSAKGPKMPRPNSFLSV